MTHKKYMYTYIHLYFEDYVVYKSDNNLLMNICMYMYIFVFRLLCNVQRATNDCMPFFTSVKTQTNLFSQLFDTTSKYIYFNYILIYNTYVLLKYHLLIYICNSRNFFLNSRPCNFVVGRMVIPLMGLVIPYSPQILIFNTRMTVISIFINLFYCDFVVAYLLLVLLLNLLRFHYRLRGGGVPIVRQDLE